MLPELGRLGPWAQVMPLLFLMLLGLRVKGQEPTPMARLLAGLTGLGLALELVCWPSGRLGRVCRAYRPNLDPPSWADPLTWLSAF